jgi:prevent-host-death family protein
MTITSVAAIKSRFTTYLKASEKGPVVIARKGKPIAVLLSVEDEGELERLVLAYSPTFQKIIETAKQQIRKGAGISHQDLWHQVES